MGLKAMRFGIVRVGLTAVAVCAAVSYCVADTIDFENDRWHNWHQWRGPEANGVARHGKPPLEWSEQKNIRWKVALPGKGSGSPIVWKDHIFLATALATERAGPLAEATEDQEGEQPRRGGRRGRSGFGVRPAPMNYHQFVLLCLDRETGNEVWRQVAVEAVPHEPGHDTNSFASGSPVTDGEFVYVSFGSHGIYCYDLDGNLQWQKNLGRMRTRNAFGEGSSPALHGDTLVVNWDHEGPSFITALDARTGQTRWQVDRDEPTTWATPLVIEHNGRTQVIVNGTNRARSYDLKTGEVIWECGGQAANPIASPLVQDGVVYCMTGHRGYAVYAIPLDAQDDITDTDQVVWYRHDVGSYVASPTVYDGRLYLTKSRDAILLSVDARTGDPIIEPSRLPGLSTLYSSLVAADGRIYVSDRDGTTLVLKHAPQLEILATNKLDDGIDASFAMVGNQLFIRGENHLYCVQE